MPLPLLDDKEWGDADLAAAPATASGQPIVWQVYTADTHGTKNWADFKAHECLRMETALIDKVSTVILKVNDYSWAIDVINMIQTNDVTKTRRPIRRTVIVKQGDFTD